MADLEANFMHLQLMHESLSRFSENFASFLYGLNMNAFCVDFPEVAMKVLCSGVWRAEIVRPLFPNHSSGRKKQRLIKVCRIRS
jgi:DASH complex subunit Dam1